MTKNKKKIISIIKYEYDSTIIEIYSIKENNEKIKISRLTLSGIVGNCKLNSIYPSHTLVNILGSSSYTEESKKNLVKTIKSIKHQLFGTTNDSDIKILIDYFEFAYIISTPLGYGRNKHDYNYNQVHYCIKGVDYYNFINGARKNSNKPIVKLENNSIKIKKALNDKRITTLAGLKKRLNAI